MVSSQHFLKEQKDLHLTEVVFDWDRDYNIYKVRKLGPIDLNTGYVRSYQSIDSTVNDNDIIGGYAIKGSDSIIRISKPNITVTCICMDYREDTGRVLYYYVFEDINEVERQIKRATSSEKVHMVSSKDS